MVKKPKKSSSLRLFAVVIQLSRCCIQMATRSLTRLPTTGSFSPRRPRRPFWPYTKRTWWKGTLTGFVYSKHKQVRLTWHWPTRPTPSVSLLISPKKRKTVNIFKFPVSFNFTKCNVSHFFSLVEICLLYVSQFWVIPSEASGALSYSALVRCNWGKTVKLGASEASHWNMRVSIWGERSEHQFMWQLWRCARFML